MTGALWLIPVLPLTGFVVLAVFGGRLTRRGIAGVAVGATGLAALTALAVAARFIAAPPADGRYVQLLWHWLAVGGLHADIALSLDALSTVMILVVTVVGFLIHLYSAAFMARDEGYRRYFAYLNLFVAAMLVLVLADNLLFLYLGWEGVGLCSYLLIGFWYRNEANGRAARKAFIVTRVADTAFAVGLFVIFSSLHTLDIQALMLHARDQWAPGSGVAVAAAALLLAGAVGKSAQVPLQVWLPDAMAGPSPVSALIHAATMVTAGVYLIARTHVLFALAPPVQTTVAAVGAVTLLLAAGAALVQTDIKRVLAYSTVSQIGYMFLALGVGAWSAAVFHFMTHAFFKALLFLSAGLVIHALDDEHDIFKMGGLRRHLPGPFWGFMIGGASLAALPLVTAGFYSKDQILWSAWSSAEGGFWLWAAGWLGALLTGVYTFRLIFIVFFGEVRTPVSQRPGVTVLAPVAILATLSVVAGFLWVPAILGNVTLLPGFLHRTLPAMGGVVGGERTEWLLELLAAAASVGGIGLAYGLYLRRPQTLSALAARRGGDALRELMFQGWGFDAVYRALLLRPFLWVAETSRRDIIDHIYETAAQTCRGLYYVLSAIHNGRLRWYAAGIAAGSALLVTLTVFG